MKAKAATTATTIITAKTATNSKMEIVGCQDLGVVCRGDDEETKGGIGVGVGVRVGVGVGGGGVGVEIGLGEGFRDAFKITGFISG